MCAEKGRGGKYLETNDLWILVNGKRTSLAVGCMVYGHLAKQT